LLRQLVLSAAQEEERREVGMLDPFYPVQVLADRTVLALLGSEEGPAAAALNFFIYDTVKIILLLFVMIAAIGVLRTYLSRKRVKEWLMRGPPGQGNVFAAVFGAVSPFCSCSSVPIFIGFMEAGIPLGIAFSFLITSPLINEYIAIIMLSEFGWRITAAYIASGMTIGIVAGMALGRMGLEVHLVEDLVSPDEDLEDEEYGSMRERVDFGIEEARDIVGKVWRWVVAGVAIGAFLHGYVPADAIQDIISRGGVLMVPIATALGVPLYANCSAVVPIAVVLFQKGVPLGTALAFMMATAALSVPEAVILRRAMKLPLILVFFGTVAIGIVITGYMFNVLQVVIIG